MNTYFKRIMLWVTLPLFVCCSDINEPVISIEKDLQVELPVNKYEITQEQALENAISTLNILNGNDVSRSRHYKVASVDRVINNYDSRSEYSNGCYLFNFENNEGFALVSADVRDSVSVYLSANEGYLPKKLLEDENNGMGFLLSLIESHQMYKASTYEEPVLSRGKNYSHHVTTTVLFNVPSLIETKWRQSYPFNCYRTDGYAMGCVPVAMGQVMAYHRHPNSVEVDGINYVFDWSKIETIKCAADTLNYPGNIYEVSKLLNAIGVSGDASYGTSTGVLPTKYVSILNEFGYTCSSFKSYSESSIYSELNSLRPVLMRGNESVSNGGHAWVVTGALYIEEDYQAYDDETGEPIENDILEMYNYKIEESYILINWGWGYMNDSKYLVYSRQTADMYPTSTYVNSGVFIINNLKFDTNIQIITNIIPE